MPQVSERVWYLVRDGAHEGPFSLEELEVRQFREPQLDDVDVWARGWPAAVKLQELRQAYLSAQAAELALKAQPEYAVAAEPSAEVLPPARGDRRAWLLAGVAALVLLTLASLWTLPQTPELVRPDSVSLELFRSLRDAYAELPAGELLPRVVVSRDYSHLSFLDKVDQQCSYELRATSTAADNLGTAEQHFEGRALGAKGWVVFERLSFSAGEKLHPGFYQFELVRRDCQASGVRALWAAPLARREYRFRAPLYAGEPRELEQALDAATRERRKAQRAVYVRTRRAWRDIEEKYRTMIALTLQVETVFAELLERRYPWPERLQRVVDAYTLRFGGLLTNFVVQNDEDFTQLAVEDLKLKVELMAQQSGINTAAKKVGHLSMSFIEKLQRDKKVPQRVDLEAELRALRQTLEAERKNLERLALEAQANSVRKLEDEGL